MPKRRTQTISLVATTIIVGAFAFIPHIASAQVFLPFIGDSIVGALKTALLAAVSPTIGAILMLLTALTTFFVWAMGIFLDCTILINLHIADIVSQVSSINKMWTIVRDLMSIVLIFAILYSAILMILGFKGSSTVKSLLVNVVLAGIFINFSLFFTKAIIDASNIPALYLYNQIIPSTPISSSGSELSQILQQVAGGGNLTLILMKGLYLQTTLAPSLDINAAGSFSSNMIIGMTLSNVVMIIAGFSFLAAGFIFLIRMGYLLLLMAFSPIWWIGLVLPQAKDYSTKWAKTLIGECMIAPIYMLFLYFTILFITDPNISALKSITDASSVVSGGNINSLSGLASIGTAAMIFKFSMAIILLNFCLMAAKSFGSKSGELGHKSYSWIRQKASAAIGFGAGMAATSMIESSAMARFYANNPHAGRVVHGGLSNVASKYEKSKKADEKIRKDMHKVIGTVHRADFKTDEEFETAQRDRLSLLEEHAENLRSSPISKLLGVHRTGHDLEKENKKIKDKLDLKQKSRRYDEIEKQLIKDPSRPPLSEEMEKRLLDEKADLAKEIVDIKKRVENEETERIKKIIEDAAKPKDSEGEKPNKPKPSPKPAGE